MGVTQLLRCARLVRRRGPAAARGCPRGACARRAQAARPPPPTVHGSAVLYAVPQYMYSTMKMVHVGSYSCVHYAGYSEI